MPLVNSAIPALVGGVSQQPPALRHPTQVEAMDNMVPSLAAGLRKRIGTKHVNKIVPAGVDHQYAFVHTIDRGTDERYFVVINNGTLKVYDFTGNEKVVNFPDGTNYLSGNFNARDHFHAVTVADYTFITQTSVLTFMEPAAPATPNTKCYVVVKLGVINQTYYINLNGNLYQYATGPTSASTIDIASNLASAINAGGLFSATTHDNLIEIAPTTAPSTYTWVVSDTYGDTAMFAFRDEVARYEDLPRKFVENVTVHVTGGPDGSSAGFYVKWVNDGSKQTGVWQETVKPGLQVELMSNNMPHTLVRESDGSFTFNRAQWKKRLVGDDDSAPLPSFMGRTISAVFFHRNRLGFLSDENIILSGAGDYFNFFVTSARAVIDSDPIDVSASTTKVTLLKHVVPFDRSLLVFSDKAQFQFTGDNILTAASAKLEPTTTFEASALCPPASLGRNVFFATNRGNFTSLREYYYDGTSVTNDAVDVTAHTPSYVPTGVFRLTTAPTEDMLFALTTEERDAVYVYNSTWNAEEKVQSSWHRWKFRPTDLIIACDVFGTTLTFLVQRADGVYLEAMELEERPTSPAPFTICLDRRVQFTDAAYHAGQKRTFWTLPYSLPAGAVPVAVICDKTGEKGQGLDLQIESGSSVSLKGDYRDTIVVIGIKFDASVTLSQVFLRDGKNNAIVNTRVQLRDMAIEYDRTGFFEAHVAASGRDTDTYQYSGRSLGGSLLKLGTEAIGGGKFTFPIMCRADEATISLTNSTHLPCAFLSAEWQGFVAMQAGRR